MIGRRHCPHEIIIHLFFLFVNIFLMKKLILKKKSHPRLFSRTLGVHTSPPVITIQSLFDNPSSFEAIFFAVCKMRAFRQQKRQALWNLSLLQQRNRIADIFFMCLAAVFIHLSFVLFSVGEASCTAYTTTDASHAFD